jgi:hypothetical protein
MSSSINRRPPLNNDSLSANKPSRAAQTKIFTGYEAQKHGIRGTKARDTRHTSRDTRHAFHGIRGTQLTGYEAQVSRDTRHKKSDYDALQPLCGVAYRIFKKTANLSLIFF